MVKQTAGRDQYAKNNGITLSEMAEIVTYAAFYAGWPNALAVFNLVKEVYEDEIQNNNTSNEWCEAVSDEEYEKLN